MEFWNGSFVQGFINAFALVIGPGPQTSTVLTTGATARLRTALAVAVIAALCDTVLVFVGCLFGTAIKILLDRIPTEYQWHARLPFYLLIVVLLVHLAIENLRGEIRAMPEPVRKNFESIYWRIVVLTFCNPMSISESVMFLGGKQMELSWSNKLAFSFGAALASWVWHPTLAMIGRVSQGSNRDRWNLLRRYLAFVLLIAMAAKIVLRDVWQ